jgi:type IV secretion/conjugal transfer VirB4 family ATPase
MINLREYHGPKRLAHRLPWALFAAPGVMLNKVGSFMTTMEFRGPDVASSTEEELDALSAQVNNALKRLGAGRAYFIEAQRRQTQRYPASRWPTMASRLIDEERRQAFMAQDRHYITRYYLTFSYLPPSEVATKISDRFMSHDKGNGVNYAKHLDYFQAETSKVAAMLGGIFSYIEPLDDDQTLTYLHSSVSTKKHVVRSPDPPVFLDQLLTDEVFQGGLDPMLGKSHLKILSLKGFPVESWPQILQDIDTLDCEFRWMTRFICLDKLDAVKELKKYSRKWFSKRKSIISIVKEAFLNEPSEARPDSDAEAKSAECEDAAELVNSNLVSAGYYTSCIVLWNEDSSRLDDDAKKVEQLINSAGFVSVAETYNAVQAWFGSIPGHCWANVRRPLMTSMNMVHLLPTSAVWAGEEKNEHLNGPPLFYAQTEGHTPFRFSNHVGDVGHTMILGPTGAGKSVLLSFIAAQFQRYPGAEVYIFDKDLSALCMTLCAGGCHYDLGEEAELSFQPLRNIDDEMERAWALEWLQDILSQENVEITPQRKNELWDALSNLATSPAAHRTITGLVTLIQNEALRDALQVYTIDGPFGYLLDADRDDLKTATWQCFEMDHLMTYTPGVVVPVLTYLFHQLDRRFNGAPALLILDEVWLFLSNPVFSAKIKDWLKTLRKKNVSVIFATQSLSDVIQSPIVATLIDSCSVRIFLPNKKALEATIYRQYEQFGLNEKQIQLLAYGTPKKEYYCQTPLGNRKFELGLGPLALALCGSSAPKDIAKLKALSGSSNGSPVNTVIELLKYKGLYDAHHGLIHSAIPEKPD